MTTFKLVSNPTFKAKVAIPVAGSGFEPVQFVFKHRTRDEIAKFVEHAKALPDVDLVLAVAEGWELGDEFTKANIELLLNHHMGAGVAVYAAYLQELSKAVEKN